MDNDKSQGLGGREFHAHFPHSWDASGMNPEPSPSSSSSSQLPPMPPHLVHGSGSGPDVGHLNYDLSRMTDNPPRTLGHRRAHSEILLALPKDLIFDSDLDVSAGSSSLLDEDEEDMLSKYLDMDRLDFSAMSSFQVEDNSASATTTGHISGSCMDTGSASFEALAAGPNRVIRHQHSRSMDGSTSRNEMPMSGSGHGPSPSPRELKKAMSAAELAELALIDPKRAKRILANRQSAARSKERKVRYIGELEQKVQTLKTEATTLSAQLTLLQTEKNDLTAENNGLKMRMQTMEQQIQLQDALNDALKEEIVHLKVLTGQPTPNGGSMMDFSAYGLGQEFYPNDQAVHTLMTAQQLQQLQINSQTQQQQQQQQHQFRGSMTSAGQKDGNAADSLSLMKD